MRAFILSTFSLLLIASSARAATVTPTRLAVLDVASPDLSKVATLLEVELLKLPDTEALDRANLAAVLKEQQLQAALSADACRGRVALGKILKADVLVLLQMRAEPKPHGVLMIAETGRGLRLCVAPFVLTDNAAKDAQALLPQVERALDRLRGPLREIVAVPPFACDDLAIKRQALSKPLAAVIEQLLQDRPGVAVVELAEAKSLADEVTLAGEGSVTRELPLYVLGSFRHDGYGPDAKLAVELSLKRGDRLLDSKTIQDAAPAEAAKLLRQEVMTLFDKISGGGMPTANMAVEARQLADRAALMYRLSAWMDSVELAEASLLLKPGQLGLHRLIVDAVRKKVNSDYATATNKANDDALRQGRNRVYRPEQSVVDGLDRQRDVLVQRALPHFEEYMKYGALRYSEEMYGTIVGFMHCYPRDNPVLPPLMLRVLEARKAADRLDDVLIFAGNCQEACAANLNSPESWQWRLDVADRWPTPKTDERNLQRLQGIFLYNLNNTNRNDPQLLAALEKLKTSDNPAAQQLAANLQRRLDRNWSLGSDTPLPPSPKPSQPKPPEPQPSIENAEVRTIRTDIAGDRSSDIRGWITAGPGVDAFWNEDRLYLIKGRKRLERSDGIPIKSTYGADVCYDGRSVWAHRAAQSDGMPELLILDPATLRMETITAEHGLPPIPLDRVSMTVLREGCVCIVASCNGRAWIGLAELDATAKSRSLKVLHEARNVPTGDASNAWKSAKMAFNYPRAYMLTDAPAQDGTRRQRILVLRHSDYHPLLVDPATGSVEVYMPSDRFGRELLQYEGALYWMGGCKDGGRVCRFGFPTLKPEVVSEFVIPEPATEMGNFFLQPKGACFLSVGGNLWFAPSLDGKFQKLRVNRKEGFSSWSKSYRSENFGAVNVSSSLIYEVRFQAP